jgi:hypothetical protein
MATDLFDAVAYLDHKFLVDCALEPIEKLDGDRLNKWMESSIVPDLGPFSCDAITISGAGSKNHVLEKGPD